MFSALLVTYFFIVLPSSLGTPEPYLLFSTWYTVSRMNLDGSDYAVLVNSSANVGIQAIDYHQRQNTMYWGHYPDGTISRANLDGSNPEVIVSNVYRPSGLAVDWINDKVYFSFGDPDSNEVNPNHLATYDITTGEYTEISPATLYQVYYELAVEPFEEMLYWTSGSHVLQSTLNGENVQTLLTTGSCINSPTLNANLYFLHGCSSPKSVRSLNLTTLEVSIIVDDIDGMFGVAAYEDTVFWTGNARVYSTPINGSGVINELLHISRYGGSLFRGLTVVQTNMSSPTVPETESSDSSTVPETESSDSSVLVPVLITVLFLVLIVSLLGIGSGIVCYYKHSNVNSCCFQFNKSVSHNISPKKINKRSDESSDLQPHALNTTSEKNMSYRKLHHNTVSANDVHGSRFEANSHSIENTKHVDSVQSTSSAVAVTNTEELTPGTKPEIHTQCHAKENEDHNLQPCLSSHEFKTKQESSACVQPKPSTPMENDFPDIELQPTIAEKDIARYIPTTSGIAPLVVKFSKDSVPPNCFSRTISCLHSVYDWKLTRAGDGSPECFAKNIISLSMPQTPCQIILIDTGCNFQIHLKAYKGTGRNDFPKLCFHVKESIFTAIDQVCDIDVSPAFLCSCRVQPQSHLATVDPFNAKWFLYCSVTTKGIGNALEEHIIWLDTPVSEKKKLSLQMLLRFKVPQKVGANYHIFGTFMLDDDDGSLVDALEVDCQGKCQNIVIKILSEWLRGKGKPVTLEELIESLKVCDLKSLANNIQENMQ